MTGLGHKRKCSIQAETVRFTPQKGTSCVYEYTPLARSGLWRQRGARYRVNAFKGSIHMRMLSLPTLAAPRGASCAVTLVSGIFLSAMMPGEPAQAQTCDTVRYFSTNCESL